ncbi:MAG: RNA polymerase sigma factor [Prolixibacteraceae bacterium]|nr:RNA polymerase sigma factor [Prolixibacteraceae bacterium]
MLQKSEIILVGQCRKGNVKAQYNLYRLYAKGMYNVAIRMVGDSQVAEDILQEAFIKAFNGLDKLQNDVAFGSWLKRIVINLCIDYSRKDRFVFAEIDEIKGSDFISEEIDDETDPAFVHELIKKLPEGARQILVMRAIEGYRHAEIGEELGISESTAKTQFFRARQLLAEMIKEKWNEDRSRKISERKTASA